MDNIEENKVDSRLNVVSESVAEADFNKWIGIINPPKRVVSNGSKTTQLDIIEKIMSGDIVIGDDGVLDLKLSHPLTGARPVGNLKFKPRFKTSEIRKCIMRVPDGDRYGMLMAHAVVLTGVEMNVQAEFEKTDFNIISAIVSYFL